MSTSEYQHHGKYFFPLIQFSFVYTVNLGSLICFFYDKLHSLLLASVNIQMTLSECTWFKLSSCLLVWTTTIMKHLSIAICKGCRGRPSWAPYNGPPPELINHTYTCVTACVSACVWLEKKGRSFNKVKSRKMLIMSQWNAPIFDPLTCHRSCPAGG